MQTAFTLSKLRRQTAVAITALLLSCAGLIIAPATASAVTASCTPLPVTTTPDGAVLLPGTCWLGGQGVDVKSSTQDGSPTSAYQCVELVTRLYDTRGWGTGSWPYANGNTIWQTHRAGLTGQTQGQITYLSPGDAISLNVVPPGGPAEPDGHVGIVDTITRNAAGTYSIVFVSQNSFAVQRQATWDGSSSITIPGGGGWTYPVTGVLHRPIAVPPTLPKLTNGTFLRTTDNNEVYRIAGGAPIYVNTWAPYGHLEPTVSISRTQLNAMRFWPADNTFIRSSASTTSHGQVYRVAGHAPIYVSTWAAYGGKIQPTILIPQGAVDNAGAGGIWSHLAKTPADGSLIRGGQTGRVYRMTAGAPYYVIAWDTINPHGIALPSVSVDQGAIDHAGQTGVWSHLAKPASLACPGACAPFAGSWGGHTRSMTISKDGRGSTFAQLGCCGPVEQIVFQIATWQQAGSSWTAQGAILSVKDQISNGKYDHPGYGTLTLTGGVITGSLVGFDTNYCNVAADLTGVCGA